MLVEWWFFLGFTRPGNDVYIANWKDPPCLMGKSTNFLWSVSIANCLFTGIAAAWESETNHGKTWRQTQKNCYELVISAA